MWKTCSAIILVWLDFASSSGSRTPIGSQSSCHSEMHGEWWRDSSSCLKWKTVDGSQCSFTFVISNKNGCRHHSPSILFDITYKLSNKLKYIKKQRVREKNVPIAIFLKELVYWIWKLVVCHRIYIQCWYTKHKNKFSLTLSVLVKYLKWCRFLANPSTIEPSAL